jgi:hypothetical protein
MSGATRGSQGGDGEFQRVSGRNPLKLELHSRIMANYEGMGTWYAGRISAMRRNGTYDIIYDDGDEEKEREAKYIRREKEKRKKKTKRSAAAAQGVTSSVTPGGN